MLGVRAGPVPVGLVLGAGEDVLELAGAAGDGGWIELAAVVDRVVLLGVGGRPAGACAHRPCWRPTRWACGWGPGELTRVLGRLPQAAQHPVLGVGVRGGGGGRWPVALMATRLGPDGRVRGGARRRISPPRLQQAWQQRHGLLEAPCRDYPAAGGPHPLEGPSERPSGVLAGPAPGLRPPAARRALGRHQAPTRVVPAPARDRADLAPASAPRPSSTPSRTSPAHLPGAPAR